MYYVLIVLLIIVAILLAVAVLLQAGQGGGLASLGGGTTDLVVGGRQAVTILTKGTWILGGIFLFLSLLISLVSPSQGGGSEVLQRIREGQAPATAPANLPIETVRPDTGARPAGDTATRPAP
ncbi:MAG TPA: preprotein translocase subunit SecG [Gemmatimonadales bacterium]|jgi:preprotein translocase subunit SecG|nr:preprotein translocase subunit SecG [Gemmatimonadales bacterium]